AAVRRHLAPRMPGGIVPLLVVLDELPVRTSGKVDRAALPWPPPAAAAGSFEDGALDGTATWLAECWTRQLGPLPLGSESDFFELGGSSLAAARLVSEVRMRFPGVAVADVYEHRRLGAMAARLDALGERRGERVAERTAPPRRWAAAQVAGVLVLLAVTVPAWLAGIFAFNDWQGAGPRIPWPWLVLGYAVLVSAPGRAGVAIVARRLLLGRLRPGRYPRRSWIASRVWFVDRLADVLHLNSMAGTPWAGRIARLLGADVAPTARLATMPSPASLIHVGDMATLEADVDVHGWWIEGDELVVGELRVGRGARVGTRSVLMPGTDIGAGAEIEPGSVISTAVPAGERWAGSPARQVGSAGGSWPAVAPPREARPWLWKGMFAAGTLLIGVLSLVAAVPGILLLDAVGGLSSSFSGTALSLILASPALAATFVVSEAILNALAFRAASRFIRPGWHGDEGATAWALWFTGQIHEASVTTLFPLYATVFTRAWLRLHGVRVGPGTEVSTAGSLNRLVTLGTKAMVADHPMFAGVRANHGWLHLQAIAVGDGTFIGNGAIVTGGTTIGDGCLIGIETNAPRDAPDGTSWLGAPPLELPRIPDATDPARTTDPPRRLVLARAATEVVRILLPTSVSIVLGALVLLAIEAVGAAAGGLAMIAAAPLAVAAGAIGAVLVTVAVKWVVIGRYRPGEHPLWSWLVWRDEIVNSCQEQLASEWLLQKAQGTPIVSTYLRAMGARVGRDVWCDTLAVTEFDMVTLGDGCAVNRGACLETHLFHDRLLRIGPTEMGAGSTLGPVSAILPESKLGAACVVGGRSVVLRGEELPAGTRWHGAPVVSLAG
ncbi:MAG: Amino acid adenylation protein, partial [Solirubrobacterales bacterium]|nr:Amino acid adenylation protein [Solirubrobacterales bacterium]